MTILRSLISESAIDAHRRRALTPDKPVIRGTAQNPDVFFQAREAANPFYDNVRRHRRALDEASRRTHRPSIQACLITKAIRKPNA